MQSTLHLIFGWEFVKYRIVDDCKVHKWQMTHEEKQTKTDCRNRLSPYTVNSLSC